MERLAASNTLTEHYPNSMIERFALCNTTIIAAETATDLETQVNGKLEYGWRPQGGVQVLYSGGEMFLFFQALVHD